VPSFLSSTKTVAVCGSIAVGKTSFVPLLAAALPGGRHRSEDVYENLYLADFYRDMKAWSFHSRIAFLAMKSKVYQNVEENCTWMVIDRPINELITFARFHRDLGLLSTRDFDTFLSLYETLTSLLPAPDIIVYLHCSPEESLRRIRVRGRNFEQSIDLPYLRRLSQYYDEWLNELEGIQVIEAHTEDLSKIQDLANTIGRNIYQRPEDTE
jgi:deoxyadenosine/deoxycytidine kinase